MLEKIMKLWIARDLDGTLGLLDGDKPKPILGEWMPNNNYYNSPQQVEIKLINE